MVNELLVVNIRGMINIRHPVKKTLEQLGLFKKYQATILPSTEVNIGMLKKIKDHVAWYPIEPSFLSELIEKRVRKKGWKSLKEEDLLKLGFKNFEEFANNICVKKKALYEFKDLKRSFSLAPPRGGFKRSIRRMYTQGGLLGENPELEKIVKTMLP
jgi:large subunit ribosomal protein L30